MPHYKDLLDTKKLGISDVILRMPLADRRDLTQTMMESYSPDQIEKIILPALKQLQNGIAALHRPGALLMDSKAVEAIMETITISIAGALSAEVGTNKYKAIKELVTIHTASILLQEIPPVCRPR
ncbi:MAG: hypothetical protein ACK502_05360 [Alphaproteobacteria bacterium]